MEPVLSLIIVVFTLTAPVNGQCSGKADVVIAVPGAWVVPHSQFITFEDNLITLLNHFHIAPDHVNIGLILYGWKPVPIVFPQPFKLRHQVNTRVTLLGQRVMHSSSLFGPQNVARAINEVRAMLLAPPKGYPDQMLRPGARKIGIIFVYGNSSADNVQKVIDEAAKARQDNVVLYALGTNGTGQEFPQIGFDYCRLFGMGSFAEGLPFAMPDLASAVCSEIDPSISVTARNCFPRRYGEVQPIQVECNVNNRVVQPDPNNCAYFYRCPQVNRPPVKSDCGIGTIYDPLVTGCNFPESTLCYNDLSCPDKTPMLHPHPLDCSKFISCDADMVPHVQDCATGSLFDFQWQTCNNTEMVTCLH